MRKKKKTNEEIYSIDEIEKIYNITSDERNNEENNEANSTNNEKEINIDENLKTNNKEKEDTKRNKKNKKKKKGKLKKIILIIFALLLILATTVCGLFFIRVQKNGGGLQGVLATLVGHDENTLKNLPKVYCLVTGQSQNLTDTIMLCSYDPKTQEASILSIPRDTFIGRNKSRATSYDKINALYQSGPEKTMEAVSEITGIDIKYYINIDTVALRKVVDSIGGVNFNVPIDMDYDDGDQDLHIHLNKGYQLLDGDKAEQVVRFRHNTDGTTYSTEYGDNDLGRMKTQRNFIKAVIKKLATPSSLTKVNDLIKIAEENVTTNIDLNVLKDYAPYAIKFDVDNLKTATLPGTPELQNKIWIYSYNKTETKEVVDELFNNQEDEDEVDVNEYDIDEDEEGYKNKNSNTIKNTTSEEKAELAKKQNAKIKIELLNGTSDTEKLDKVKTELKKQGYTITKTGITTNTSKTTIINRKNIQENHIEEIQDILDITGSVSKGSNNSDVDITIIIGKDY